MMTATFTPHKEIFIPTNNDSTITAYQCAGQSILRPERFLIYYGIFRPNDKNPTPELIAKWKIKSKTSI